MEAQKRAILMLRVAATYILANDTEGEVEYDGATCDGYCVAEDCETAAAELEESCKQ